MLKGVDALNFETKTHLTYCSKCDARALTGFILKFVRFLTVLLSLTIWNARFAAAQDITSPYIPGAVPRFTVIRHPGLSVDDAMSASALGSTIPMWSGSFTSNSTVYPFVMVGTNPSQGSVSTTVSTVVVPLIFKFHSGTAIHALNPALNVCGGTHSAVNLTRNSPIFQSFAYNEGGVALGTTQYLDAFQRANFWNDVSTTSPNYHVLLSKTGQTLAVVVNVPASDGSWIPLNGSKCPRVGEVDINWFDGTIVQGLLTKMAALTPAKFPIFLAYNVFLFQGSPLNCCILGYHSAVMNTKGTQTYAYVSFNDPNLFQGSPPLEDIDGLSHEVGEWMDDPLTTNTTPPWGGGQILQGQCSTSLEVGDPLTGTAFTIANPANHFTYHPQDLAFVPWFAEGPTSTSLNGWFDFQNVFPTSAAPCTPAP
jgi:hypothetical protein